MNKIFLQIKNLKKVFNKDTDFPVIVLNNFNLEINEGDYISILGSNGTGKSTLFKCLARQIDLDNGDIILEDKKLLKFKEYEVSKFISQVKQNPNDNLVLSLTLLENLCLAHLRSGKAGFKLATNKKIRKHFHELLKGYNLNLENRLDDVMSNFSGGQKQAIALIMATLNNPKILLLDEHTASLDPINSEKIITLTKKIVADKNITTLMITHNINHAIECGNKLILLEKGRVKFEIGGQEKRDLKVVDMVTKMHNNSVGEVELEVDI